MSMMKKMAVAALVAFMMAGVVQAETLTQVQIRETLANSANSMIAHKSEILAAEAIEQSGGKTDAYNGTCCNGLWQIQTGNLKSLNITGTEYREMSVEKQAEIYLKLQNMESRR
ncbi:hypothetical protein [Bradyrhizobium elkanii]|uniref:hypothetical protein n=1 Tax=Bradyrhizobium elkanii TaxID=29448 RepID=UPI0035116903